MEILREVLVEMRSIKDTALKHGVHPNSVFQWRKTLFDRGSVVFQPADEPVAFSNDSENTVSHMDLELKKRDTLIKELLQENVELKKNAVGKR